MKTQHTTEKWCAYNCRGIKTFKSWRVHDGTEKQNLICTLHDVDGAMERAFLIESAPALLEACQLAAVRLESGNAEEIKFNSGIASKLRAAIAQATGGEQ